MKIRNGFVSNSSSSSFIVRLDKDIDEYTLEEFRELCGKNNYFDPVKMLYEDLKNKENSRRQFSDWEKDYLGFDDLGENEYYVSYEDSSEALSFMEHDFMPYLDIVVESSSQH